MSDSENNTNVVNLHDSQLPDGEVNEDAVEMIERLLERIKSGELQSVAYVGYNKHADLVRTGWETGGYTFQTIAGLDIIKSRLIVWFTEDD